MQKYTCSLPSGSYITGTAPVIQQIYSGVALTLTWLTDQDPLMNSTWIFDLHLLQTVRSMFNIYITSTFHVKKKKINLESACNVNVLFASRGYRNMFAQETG